MKKLVVEVTEIYEVSEFSEESSYSDLDSAVKTLVEQGYREAIGRARIVFLGKKYTVTSHAE